MVRAESVRQCLCAPLGPVSGLCVASIAVAAASAQCILHELSRGHWVGIGVAVGWATVAIGPYGAAFELTKRLPADVYVKGSGVLLVAATLVSVALELSIFGAAEPPRLLEVVTSRVQVCVALMALAGISVAWRSPGATPVPRPGASSGGARPDLALPLPPEEIVLARAAGNYVEIHGSAASHLVRVTLSALEAHLQPFGFVRIHRSVVVRRSAIVDLAGPPARRFAVLSNGQQVPIGQAYRDRLGGT